MKEFNTLTPTQRAAIDFVVSHAERESNEAQGPLNTRLASYGYTCVRSGVSVSDFLLLTHSPSSYKHTQRARHAQTDALPAR